mgnify:CR=1 FL=1
MIVLVRENYDKRQNVTQVQHFCRGFDHANRASSYLKFGAADNYFTFIWKQSISSSKALSVPNLQDKLCQQAN